MYQCTMVKWENTKKVDYMRKYIFAICVGIVVMCLCVGCNKNKKRKGDVDLPQLIIGSDNYDPYYFINEQGKTVGIDVELAREACRRIGYKPVFKKIVWDNKDIELEAGNIVCIWGSYTMTGRENEYQWAGPYMYSHQVIVVSAESNIKTIAGLKDKKIAVQVTGKPEEIFLKRLDNRIPEVEDVYSFSDIKEVFACLREGYVDAIAGHESTLNKLIDENNGDYYVLDENLYVSELGVAFLNNYKNKELINKLSDTLEDMRKDGTIEKILDKYDISPQEAYIDRE